MRPWLGRMVDGFPGFANHMSWASLQCCRREQKVYSRVTASLECCQDKSERERERCENMSNARPLFDPWKHSLETAQLKTVALGSRPRSLRRRCILSCSAGDVASVRTTAMD